MIYNKLYEIAKTFPNKLSINNLSYKELLDKVDQQEYTYLVDDYDYHILIKLFKAAKINKPILILPKKKRDEIKIPLEIPERFGVFLYSSGSSGKIRNPIFLSENMIFAISEENFLLHDFNTHDKIYTVCSLNHTGGLNVQTLSAILHGIHVIIEPFNAFNFFRKVFSYNITISHLIPPFVDALIKLDYNFSSNLRLLWLGGDCVYKNHIEYFLQKDIDIIQAYGMTEAGPPIFWHLWQKHDDLSILNNGAMLGDNCVCDYKIIESELYLKGQVVYTDDWFATGDCVKSHGKWLQYLGRKSHGCKIIPKEL